MHPLTEGEPSQPTPYYRIELPNGIKVTAVGREQHELAIEAIERIARINLAPHAPPPQSTLPVAAPAPSSAESRPSAPLPTPLPAPTPRPSPPNPPHQKGIGLVHAMEAAPETPDWEAVAALPSRRPSPTLSSRIEPYVAFAKQRGLAFSVVNEMEFVLNLFLDLAGDKPLNDYGIEDSDLFLDAMSAWPKHAQRRADYRHMRGSDIVAKAKRDGVAPISLPTQQKHVDYMRGFFHWCRERKFSESELFEGIRLFRHRGEVSIPRQPYTQDELALLFSPTHLSGIDAPHKYWVPLIALYMGMRINEIAQLYIEDVVLVGEEGQEKMLCLNVAGDRAGQHIKTPYARRIMPIHPRIIELGFKDYLRDLRETEAIHLFPGLTWTPPGPGNPVSDWFNRTHLRGSCGITSRSKTFHGFRHTFATLADRSGVPEARISQLMGHCTGSSTAQRHYIKPAEVREMKEFMGKIVFPTFETPSYRKGMFHTYLQGAKAKADRKARTLAEEAKGKPRATMGKT